MNSKSSLAGFVVVAVLSGAVLSVACSSPTSPQPGVAQGDDTKNDTSTDPTTPAAPAASAPGASAPAASASASSTAAPPAADDATCAAKSGDACYTCCSQNHPAGGDAADTAEATCICAPTRCGTQCATSSYCSDADNAPDPVDGDACSTCIAKYENDDGTGECDTAITTAIQGNADGTAYLACENNCPD